MRLWSIHPKYLDCKGILGLWREALLAKKVLEGKTKSYVNHPQLERFKEQKEPVKFIKTYLLYIWKESDKRCYRFDKTKIGRGFTNKKIKTTEGQIKYEFKHLKDKLKKRNTIKYKELMRIKKIEPNPLFKIIKGPIERWEKQK
ncbi:pyrimidine dimer DNA glycosylase/endonuclease V [Candidatus Woesearchaeota archaeon]|nr:pyrimidine dimer DNA glycosylase/endonuclease V [Candidatus Woesearchaeota archaeon]